jgi:hypothetical protein
MAAWQASFQVLLGTPALPPDYKTRLDRVLPRGRHWHADGERWGSEDGDTVEVFSEPPAEIYVRFDLREWRPDLYERFLGLVQGVGARLRDPEQDSEVALAPDAFMETLRRSRAARFVKDPQAYVEELRVNPIRMPEEP